MNSAEEIPLYLNWQFWTFVAAAAALILSQLPPIVDWFKRPHLSLEVHSRISLTHSLGNPNAQIHLIISNDGGRTVRIRTIEAEFVRDGSHRIKLPVQNYFYETGDTDPLLFTPVALYIDEDWSHTTNFFNYFERADERRVRDAESNLRQNILEKRGLLKKEELVEADSEYVTPISEFFDEKFDWLPGEYELKVTVSADSVSAVKNYFFTIFESESLELRRVAESYKFGAWVYWNPETLRHPSITIQLREANA